MPLSLSTLTVTGRRTQERSSLLLQNVDGLHQRAGSKNVVEYHGTLMEAICMTCSKTLRLDKEAVSSPAFRESLPPKVSVFNGPRELSLYGAALLYFKATRFLLFFLVLLWGNFKAECSSVW